MMDGSHSSLTCGSLGCSHGPASCDCSCHKAEAVPAPRQPAGERIEEIRRRLVEDDYAKDSISSLYNFEEWEAECEHDFMYFFKAVAMYLEEIQKQWHAK